jgi:hypothetical protein
MGLFGDALNAGRARKRSSPGGLGYVDPSATLTFPDPSRAPRRGPKEGCGSHLTRGPLACVTGALVHWKDTRSGHRPRRPSARSHSEGTDEPKEGVGTGGCHLPGIWNPSRGKSVKFILEARGLPQEDPGDWERQHTAPCEAQKSPCAGSRLRKVLAERRLGSEWRAPTRVRGRVEGLGAPRPVAPLPAGPTSSRYQSPPR